MTLPTTSHCTRRPRAGYSLLEVGLIIGLIALVGLWVVPRLVADDVVASDHTAQAHVDLALDAALAVRRDSGSFPSAVADLERYTVDVPVTGPADPALVPGEVSVGISSPGSLATVTAAAVTDDGVCWMVRRAFGTEDFSAVYAYSTAAPCNADAASSLVPDAGQPGVGERWSRPLDATP